MLEDHVQRDARTLGEVLVLGGGEPSGPRVDAVVGKKADPDPAEVAEVVTLKGERAAGGVFPDLARFAGLITVDMTSST
jgi:hypothetical protein